MAKQKRQPSPQPKRGQPFVFRGKHYVVGSVDAASGGILIERPKRFPKSEGHYKHTSGLLKDVAWAGEGFWYFKGTIAESMRGLPLAEVQAVQLMPIYEQGRDDLALAAFHGEPRGVPGAKSVFHGREHLRAGALAEMPMPGTTPKPSARRKK